MTTPNNETDPVLRVPRGRRAVRIVAMCVVVAAMLFLAATSWTHG
jgi:TRAP-type C4-dicarboxylate transport system permease small subunit